MKPLKYALVFLFLILCCFSAEAANSKQDEYMLEVFFTGVEEDGAIRIQVPGSMEISLGVAKDCRFFDRATMKEMAFPDFVKRFLFSKMEIVFVEDGEDDIIIECRGMILIPY